MAIICTVCARGGSTGVQNKNIRDLAGKPLIAWTVEFARSSGVFDLVVVSSDSQSIRDVGANYGADLIVDRPCELATNESGKLPAILHALDAAEQMLGRPADSVVDLDVTAPLRLAEDLAGALALFVDAGSSSVLSGALARKSPYFNLVEEDNHGHIHLVMSGGNILRRQDAPKCFDLNGSIYIWDRDRLVDNPRVLYPDTVIYEMPEERAIDIDSPLDFEIAEMLMLKRLAASSVDQSVGD